MKYMEEEPSGQLRGQLFAGWDVGLQYIIWSLNQKKTYGSIAPMEKKITVAY